MVKRKGDMKRNRRTLLKTIVGGVLSIIFCFLGTVGVFADGKFSVSPMNQRIVLTAGETYKGSFKVSNPASSTTNFSYKATVSPFYVSDNYEPIYENNGDYSQMVDWIKIQNPEGKITPNDVIEIYFSINVPKNAPAGGQYAAIMVTSDNNADVTTDTINIDKKYSIAHIIYAEVAGTTKRDGNIFNANVPGFILDGNISGISSVENRGNVHGVAKYTLQVWPLFSNEEIYTNEEEPLEKVILPGRTLTNTFIWEETPMFGFFNVRYTVEFEGVTTEITKLVIKCPLWILAIIIFVIVAIILWIVARNNSRKKSKKSTEKSVDIA